MTDRKKRFAMVGTGARAPMFLDPIVSEYADKCELVALCDPSHVRMGYHRKRLAESYGYTGEVSTYRSDEFDRMLYETNPDTVIVCSVDSTHHEYVIRSLDRGCDVICEKPLTTDVDKCRAILAAVERTGRKVCVTFNLRWTPGATRIRELIQRGSIGSVKQVSMEYMLDRQHGADYFRRWHSRKENSGGLLVHKSTHHFDLVNWWVDSIPKTVFAEGGLLFYGKGNAIARGDEILTRHTRSRDSNPEIDPFYFNIHDTDIKSLYLDAESETGYVRDRNVFRDDIDIEDAMSAIVRYRNGAIFNYSLNSFCPREGYRVSITGDRGRIEYEELRPFPPGCAESESPLENAESDTRRRLILMPLFGRVQEIDLPSAEGGHGGGDVMLKNHLFANGVCDDPYGRPAGAEQGAASVLVGFAANDSIKTGLPVDLGDLLSFKTSANRLSDLN